MPRPLITNFEKAFRDLVAMESTELAGSFVTLYSINQVGSIGGTNIQVLYGETDDTAGWDSTAYEEIECFFQQPDYEYATSVGGLQELRNGFVHFAKGFFDKNNLPMPKIGDIVQHPTFDYYDVKKVTREGYYSDGQDDFVEYRCEIERAKRYPPTNRI
jgi:hypothetical protein